MALLAGGVLGLLLEEGLDREVGGFGFFWFGFFLLYWFL